MEIIISNNANKPIYEQITSQIKAMIMSGELAAGDAIPSMRALAKAIHVSVITVQKPMKICKGTVLSRQRLAEEVLYRHRTRNFIRRSRRIAEEHLQAVQKSDGRAIFPLKTDGAVGNVLPGGRIAWRIY